MQQPKNIFRKVMYGSLALLFLGGLFSFLSWPISGSGDTDLWYHLNSGRYFFSHHQIADHGFFSFYGQARSWANYYWLYQLIVYPLFSLLGYPGLIFFRSLIYLVTIVVVACLLLRGRKNDSEVIYFSILAALFFCALCPRYFSMVRPHMASYLLIPVTLILLEARNRRWLFLLPALVVLWTNLHGIEYPVIMALCGAYLFEAVWGRFQKGCQPPVGLTLRDGWLILLAMAAVLLNPFGFALLKTPFAMAPDLQYYIADMAPIRARDLVRFDFSSVDGIFPALSNTILLLALLSCLRGCWNRTIRVSHLLIFLVGLYLLSRGTRFRYEAMLLALPILAAHPLVSSFSFISRPLRGLGAVFAITIVVLPWLFFYNVFLLPGHYPFSTTRLPVGITSFLRQVDTGGNILNHPSHGGFLQWELGDRYSLFMDMQMILFRDTDYLLAVSAFTDRNGLAVFVDRYRPAYIVPALGNTKFPTLIKEFPQYHLVFFDDVEALYVDREQFPEIAERFNLVHLDPFALQDLRLASFTREERAAVLAELYTMEKIFPAGQMVNQLLVLAERYQGNQLGALTHAMAIVTNHPQSPTGYKLAGEELLLFDRYEEARGFFQEALIRSGEQAKTPLYRSLWLCAKELGNSSQAYAALRSAVNPFAAEAAWADILTLARAAVDSSHFREAQVFLQLLAVRIPPAEKQAVAEWRALQMVVDNAE